MVICTNKIDLGEYVSSMQGHGEILYVLNGVTIRNCDVVEGAIISTGSPITRCLIVDHVQWKSPVTGRRSDDAQLEHVMKFIACYLEAFRS